MYIYIVLFSSYSRVLVKLVSIVVGVKERDCDNWGIPVVIAPMGYSSWQCDDVSLSEVSNLLMAVLFRPLALSLSLSLSLLRLLLRIFKCFRTPRKHDPNDSPTCTSKQKF
jgi:hypothetical protein